MSKNLEMLNSLFTGIRVKQLYRSEMIDLVCRNVIKRYEFCLDREKNEIISVYRIDYHFQKRKSRNYNKVQVLNCACTARVAFTLLVLSIGSRASRILRARRSRASKMFRLSPCEGLVAFRYDYVKRADYVEPRVDAAQRQCSLAQEVQL